MRVVLNDFNITPFEIKKIEMDYINDINIAAPNNWWFTGRFDGEPDDTTLNLSDCELERHVPNLLEALYKSDKLIKHNGVKYEYRPITQMVKLVTLLNALDQVTKFNKALDDCDIS